MDEEILKTVESMLGKNVKIVDCEKTSSVREEEILLINGIPVTLEGDDGNAIKTALMTGQVPPCDLLNQLLYQAGILRQPVQLETSLSVKSTMVTKEEVTVAKDGRILDERTSETKEDNYYTSSCKEIWEPVKSTKNSIPIKTGSSPTNDLLSPPTINETTNIRKVDHHHHHQQQQPTSKQHILLNDSVSSKLSTIAPTLSSLSSSSPISSSSSTVGGQNSLFTDSNQSSEPTSSYSSITTNGSEKFSNDLFIQEMNSSQDKIRNLHLHNNNNNNNNNNNKNNNNNNNKNNNSCSSSDVINHSLSGDCKNFGKNPSLSYDSGHDDIFNSLSHTNILQTANTDNSISSCYDFISSDEADFIDKSAASPPAGGPDKQSYHHMPTIFGTVTWDQCPKDSANRRGLPQTAVKSSVDKLISVSPSLSIESQKDNLDTDENALVYRDGNLISGSLEALILHMVPTSDYYPDRSYLFAFLLSARLFIRPHELLAKICQLCEEQQNFSNTTTSSSSNNSNKFGGQINLDGGTSLDISKVSSQHQEGVTDVFTTTTTVATNTGDGGECCRKLRIFAQHFVQLLIEWIDTFPYDFRDERLMQHVRSMTRKCINIDNSLRKDVSTMLQNLLHRLTVLEKYEEFLQSLARGSNDCADLTGLTGIGSSNSNNSKSGGIGCTGLLNTNTNSTIDTSQQSQQHGIVMTGTSQANSTTTSSSSLISNTSVTSIDISELCPNPTLLAHQLTHIELERLSHIGPEEFVQAFAKENPHLEQSFSDMKKTRNLESYVQWFNRLSYLVATEIVKHPKKKQRVRIVEYWIETARECFNIGNFNSLMAIIAGLNMSPISRLKKTWAKVQSAKFAVLEHQMDPSSNFNSYRSTLKAAMWRSAGATDERERIVIPFFSLLVKDLYFLNEGCSNKLPNGHINFEKFWQLAKQVTEFIAWKQVTCPFEKLPKVIMFLQTNHVLNENTLAMASFECEPPENHEKDRYKCLKSEQQLQQHQHQQQFQYNNQQ